MNLYVALIPVQWMGHDRVWSLSPSHGACAEINKETGNYPRKLELKKRKEKETNKVAIMFWWQENTMANIFMHVDWPHPFLLLLSLRYPLATRMYVFPSKALPSLWFKKTQKEKAVANRKSDKSDSCDRHRLTQLVTKHIAITTSPFLTTVVYPLAQWQSKAIKRQF